MKTALAQNVDSLVYDQQRRKVNGLLEERSQRFGQYYESVDKRSGIFNIQTKKDIRRSNEILMQIVQADNEILRQTKVLVDYRVNAENNIKQQARDVSAETNARIGGFTKTISKLRAQNEELKTGSDEARKSISTLQISIVGIVLFFGVTLFVLYQRLLKARSAA
ncbi:MAG: hypothetical protein INR69_00905 [Mucilaginibacter polytrichastri]|nr:hypothetical protein [Mucilaginibacter polytrichastri]